MHCLFIFRAPARKLKYTEGLIFYNYKDSLTNIFRFKSINYFCHYFSCCPRSTDRVVAVSGSVETVLNAVKQIVALVNEVDTRHKLL